MQRAEESRAEFFPLALPDGDREMVSAALPLKKLRPLVAYLGGWWLEWCVEEIFLRFIYSNPSWRAYAQVHACVFGTHPTAGYSRGAPVCVRHPLEVFFHGSSGRFFQQRVRLGRQIDPVSEFI